MSKKRIQKRATRINRFIVVSGARKVGKTTLIKELLVASKRSTLIVNPLRDDGWEEVPILAEGEMGSFKGVRQFVPKVEFSNATVKEMQGSYEVMRELFRKRRSVSIVIDDAFYYFRNRGFSGMVTGLAMSASQRDIDMYLVFHSLGQIPTALSPYITDYVIKKSAEKSERFHYKFPNSEAIFAAQNSVNLSPDRYDFRLIDVSATSI